MQITRNSLDTNAGPSDWFTGAVYIDTITAPSDGTTNSSVAPDALAWNTSPDQAMDAQMSPLDSGVM